MSDTIADIAVVGAGPVGLAAALVLDRAGYRVTLIAPPRGRIDERTSALLGGSITLLEEIGIWGELASAAAPLRALRIIDATGRLIRAPEVSFASTEIGLDAFGYNIPNSALVPALEAAIQRSGVIRSVASVNDVLAEDSTVRLNLSTGAFVTARLVVAADGRGSVTRGAAGISIREWRYDQSALVVTFRHTRPHDDTSNEFHTENGPFTLVPLPGSRSSLVWVDTTDATKSRMTLSDEALAAEIEKCSSSILGTVSIDGERQIFPLAGMNASRFASSRIALVGEAAHFFPPIGAQGLNLGYRDVSVLAEILADRPSDPGAASHLTQYDQSRRSDVLTRTTAVDALNRTLLTGFLPVQGFRSLALFLLDKVPPLRRAVMRQGVADKMVSFNKMD